jgi:hypothetical protein
MKTLEKYHAFNAHTKIDRFNNPSDFPWHSKVYGIVYCVYRRKFNSLKNLSGSNEVLTVKRRNALMCIKSNHISWKDSTASILSLLLSKTTSRNVF